MTHRDLAAQATHDEPGYVEIDPQALRDLRDARLVDVRERDEHEGELGRIPGASLVPLESLQRAALEWERATPLVVICRSGRRSAHAAAQLARLGFKQVFNLRGGMQAYRAANLPTEYGPGKQRGAGRRGNGVCP